MNRIDTLRILIADPDPLTREILEGHLEAHDVETVTALDGEHAQQLATEQEFDLVVAELHLPRLGGLELIEAVVRAGGETPVIVVAAFGSVEDAVNAIHAGATDFVSKPFTSEQLQLAIERSLEKAALVRENRDLREALDDRLRLDNLISTDARMQTIFKTVKAVAAARTTALITGESGTGKTLLARAIHRASDRKDGPFVEVNCGALPESLLESELFGHVRGAFTGAIKDRAGKFEAPDGGTIFLDEIGTSSQNLQVKLLRVLQDRVLERVGDHRQVAADVRVILATNIDLQKAVREGRFREDLYYRINVVSLEMPPLRERTGDIPLLAEHFLRRFRAETGKAVVGFLPEAVSVLKRARWPGNVRQLENVIERAVVLCEGTHIEPGDLPADLLSSLPDELGPESLVAPDAHLMPLRKALELPERIILQRALEHHDGNRQETAASLGINRSTLFNKMRKHGLL